MPPVWTRPHNCHLISVIFHPHLRLSRSRFSYRKPRRILPFPKASSSLPKNIIYNNLSLLAIRTSSRPPQFLIITSTSSFWPFNPLITHLKQPIMCYESDFLVFFSFCAAFRTLTRRRSYGMTVGGNGLAAAFWRNLAAWVGGLAGGRRLHKVC